LPALSLCRKIYALPAAFNPLNTFSGLNGSLLMRAPVVLKLAAI